MKNLEKFLAVILIIAVTLTLVVGCTNKSDNTGAETSPSASNASPDSSPSGSGSEPGASDSTGPEASISQHEIYTMSDRIALTTVIPPGYNDRSHINKALPTEQKENVSIGVVFSSASTPWFREQMNVLEAEAERYGYTINIIVSDMDMEKQSAAYETLITQGVDIIIANGIAAASEAQFVIEAVNAGIPVIGYSTAFGEEVPVITTVQQNYYMCGWEVGRYYASVTDPGTPIKAGLLIGFMGQTVSESRINGLLGGFLYERYNQLGQPFASIEDAMLAGTRLHQEIMRTSKGGDEFANFEVVASGEGKQSADGGMARTEDIITAHRDINLLISDNDQMALGAIKAMQDAGLNVGTDVKVISVSGGIKEQLAAIKAGTYFCSGVQSAWSQSGSVMALINMIFSQGFDANNLPAATELQNYVITKDNVDDFIVEEGWPITDLAEFKTIPELNAAS